MPMDRPPKPAVGHAPFSPLCGPHLIRRRTNVWMEKLLFVLPARLQIPYHRARVQDLRSRDFGFFRLS
jgi:hypothetical protein